MTDERRKRTRVPVQFEVIIVLGETEHHVETINLSLTGVLCVTNPHFQKNAPCNIRIKLNEEVKIDLEGKVLRVGEDETAISFTSMDEESFFHLKRIMELNAGDADAIDREIAIPAFK
jgi:hypothetical protein